MILGCLVEYIIGRNEIIGKEILFGWRLVLFRV